MLLCTEHTVWCGLAAHTISRNLLSWKNQVNFWLSGCRDCTSSNSDATAHLPELSGRQSSDGAEPLPTGTPSLGEAWGHSRTVAVLLPSSHPAEQGQRALTNSGENQIMGSNGRQRTSRRTKSVTKCLPGAQQPPLPPCPCWCRGDPAATAVL